MAQNKALSALGAMGSPKDGAAVTAAISACAEALAESREIRAYVSFLQIRRSFFRSKKDLPKRRPKNYPDHGSKHSIQK